VAVELVELSELALAHRRTDQLVDAVVLKPKRECIPHRDALLGQELPHELAVLLAPQHDVLEQCSVHSQRLRLLKELIEFG
jgi:hypothetical protein